MKRFSDIVIVGGSFGGIKSTWDLRNKLPARHRITLISDKPETIIRACFPRVVFEDVPLEELALDLARDLQLYSQWMSDGDVEVVKANHQAELSKIKFENSPSALAGISANSIEK